MTKLEKTACFCMAIGILSSIFVNPLKLAALISGISVVAGWLCIILIAKGK